MANNVSAVLPSLDLNFLYDICACAKATGRDTYFKTTTMGWAGPVAIDSLTSMMEGRGGELEAGR